MIRHTRIAYCICCNSAAADRIPDRQRATVNDCSHSLIGSCGCSSTSVVVKRTAVEVDREGAVIDYTPNCIVSIKIECNIVRRICRIGDCRALVFESTAVCEKSDRRSNILRKHFKSTNQSPVISISITVISNDTIIESVYVYRPVLRCTSRNGSKIWVTTGIRQTGQIPYYAIVVLSRDTYTRIRWGNV